MSTSLEFLFKILVVEEWNGLSTISVYVDTPAELIKGTEYLFHPPKRDLWDNPKNVNSTNPYDNSDSYKNFDANEHVYDMWIQILSEFNFEQLVGIVYKHHLKINIY